MTSKSVMLTNLRKYNGTNYVIISNSSSLSIFGIGDSLIRQSNIVLPLRDVLFILELTEFVLCKSTNNTIFY
jgi:hypothetical protein